MSNWSSGQETVHVADVVMTIHQSDAVYPSDLKTFHADRAPKRLFALGNLNALKRRMLALFCSVKCPGNLILKTYDLARELRDAGVTVIGGFHSPMEKECLSLLLRGEQPVVWCPARRLTARRLPKQYAEPLSEGRLLVLSPFGDEVTRATTETASFRNEFVAALADRVFVAYAAPGGKTEAFCRKVLHWGRPVLTFNSPENAALLAKGACPYAGPGSV